MIVRRSEATADEFHLRALDTNEVWLVDVTREAVVLGSRQDAAVLDLERCSAEKVDVVTRRSGGGIVHLVPGKHVWVDVTISDEHPQWTDDVVESTRWIGEAWVHALGELGIESSVFRDRLRTDRLGELICFASLGPGEVIDRHGAKLVGISQRRTRSSARFQCTVLTEWEPERLLGFLASTVRASLPAQTTNELFRRVALVDHRVPDIESAFERALLAR
jgi:lipoate-protein ligase A